MSRTEQQLTRAKESLAAELAKVAELKGKLSGKEQHLTNVEETLVATKAELAGVAAESALLQAAVANANTKPEVAMAKKKEKFLDTYGLKAPTTPAAATYGLDYTVVDIDNYRKNVLPHLRGANIVTAGAPWRLAVVMVADEAYLDTNKHLPTNVDRWRKYCELHKYTFIHVSTGPRVWARTVPDEVHFAATRLLAALEVLPGFDYVVQVSIDMVVADMSRTFEPLLVDKPDVVLSLRSHVWGQMDISSTYPLAKFPDARRPIIHPHMLHTECIIMRNTASGERFGKDLLAFADIMGEHMGVDMDAIQQAALKFLPRREDVIEAESFGVNISKSEAAFLRAGIYGFHGPFQRRNPRTVNKAQIMMTYYKITTDLLAERTTWDSSTAGKLVVLKGGVLTRDAKSRGALGVQQSDFLIHTKAFFHKPVPNSGNLPVGV